MKKIITVIVILFSGVLYAQESFVFVETSLYNKPEIKGWMPEGWIRVQKDMYIGYINAEGNEVVPPVYDEVGEFGIYKEDWAIVSKNDLMGFI